MLASGANFPGEDTCGNSECHNVTPNSGAGGVEMSINGGPIDSYEYTPGETVLVQVEVVPQSAGDNVVHAPCVLRVHAHPRTEALNKAGL